MEQVHSMELDDCWWVVQHHACMVLFSSSAKSGLPQSERSHLDNIHFLCCSNMVPDALQLSEPIVDSLLKLQEGVVMYDASLDRDVFVTAPVLMIIGDNPMCSELCNHQGNSARKFCRMCLVLLNYLCCCFDLHA